MKTSQKRSKLNCYRDIWTAANVTVVDADGSLKFFVAFIKLDDTFNKPGKGIEKLKELCKWSNELQLCLSIGGGIDFFLQKKSLFWIFLKPTLNFSPVLSSDFLFKLFCSWSKLFCFEDSIGKKIVRNCRPRSS